MEVKDLFIAPIYIMLLSMIAYFIRPYVTNGATRKYFMPALYLRFVAAISVGLLYQFYYGGGDTFSYFTYGSRWIWEAFVNDPEIGLKLLVDGGSLGDEHDVYRYSSKIWYFNDSRSYMIVKITAFFDLFTFHTYSATACFFAFFSFSGAWAMYSAIQASYKSKYLHIAVLFVPSVIFWGSGILKDSITLGALGWFTWSIFRMVQLKKRGALEFIVCLAASWLISSVKPYILICMAPTAILWIYVRSLSRIRNTVTKYLMVPVFGVVMIGSAFFATVYTSTDEYNLSNVAYRASMTAHDIRYGWGARTGGDGGYDIGKLDGTWQSMIRLMPQAINVSLFRPYLWEVRNPLMLLSALESIGVLFLTLRMVVKRKFRPALKDPFMVFCLVFSLLFAFAVGVSTFNFGSLMRYKIPLMPFFLIFVLNNPHARK